MGTSGQLWFRFLLNIVVLTKISKLHKSELISEAKYKFGQKMKLQREET